MKTIRIISLVLMSCIFLFTGCRGNQSTQGKDLMEQLAGSEDNNLSEKYIPVWSVLVSPASPQPGMPFRIMMTGDHKIKKASLIVEGPEGRINSSESLTGTDLPYWRVDNFNGSAAGKYRVTLNKGDSNELIAEFEISDVASGANRTPGSWNSITETQYSAWINILFHGCGEDSSWPALHDVTRNRERNLLFNHLSLGEDNSSGQNIVLMQPDCADNPFFLRAYFAWKLGLPFGYHVCDRGWVGRNPRAGQYVQFSAAVRPAAQVQSFNTFLRRLKDGIHSGTARTGFDDDKSDYYPVSLSREALRPGVVFADPYGHTLIVTGWTAQTGRHPGMLLSVDAQPDGTVGIKRFWKGNFLFNTEGVVGEPGFKAFRPLIMNNGIMEPVKNSQLTTENGWVAFSRDQRGMNAKDFYYKMEKLINPEPLDPEEKLQDLIKALHEQLQVRVISVSNGEKYMNTHPGTVIPMPSSANAIFQSGGQWEDFSTPNRDLRLLIAMDAVSSFPGQVAESPADYKISGLSSPEEVRDKLEKLLDKSVAELTIEYTRSDGSKQTLTVKELLARKEAFEMAYNPNDGPEIRWGAPEGSSEIATCKRHVPASQAEKMRAARSWFSKRLHPPT